MTWKTGRLLAVGAGLLAATLASRSLVRGDDASDKQIEKIMKTTHKGNDSIVKKVVAGKATPEQIDELLADYQTLAKLSPPRGSADDWKQRTSKVVAALNDVKAGKEGAAAKFKTAVSCKACHEAHKPED